jgi:hypothetical protein
LHAPVNAYLDFELRNPLGDDEVTLEHLLSHTSGLTMDIFDGLLRAPERRYLAEQASAHRAREYRNRRGRWGSRTGDKFAYSSFGLAVAAAVVEAVTGRGFGEHARATILEPLGMRFTAWPDSANWMSAEENKATGYMRFGSMAIPSPRIESGTYQSTGLVTCMGDHTKLLIALMNGGTAFGAEILRPVSVQQMVTPRREAREFGEDVGYMGLSVEMQRVGERVRAYGHSGQYPFGWQTQSWVYVDSDDAEREFAIAVAVNEWDMTRLVNPPERSATGILVEFAAKCMASGRIPPRRKRAAQSASYAMGVIAAERMFGLLGMRDALSEDVIGSIVEGARPTGNRTTSEWSPEKFVEGMLAMQGHVSSPKEIREFLQGGDCETGSEDLALYALEWGASRATSPVPNEFLADRLEEHPRYRHLRDIGPVTT